MQISADCFVVGLPNELQHLPLPATGVIELLTGSVFRSSAVEPLIAASSSYPGPQCVCIS